MHFLIIISRIPAKKFSESRKILSFLSKKIVIKKENCYIMNCGEPQKEEEKMKEKRKSIGILLFRTLLLALSILTFPVITHSLLVGWILSLLLFGLAIFLQTKETNRFGWFLILVTSLDIFYVGQTTISVLALNHIKP